MNCAVNGTTVNAVSDSDVLIDWLQGRPEAKTVFSEYDRVLLSKITWMEVLVGFRTPEQDATARRSLSQFDVIAISDAIAEEAIAIRRAQRLKIADALIFATARVSGCVLLTRNTRDFDANDPGVRIPYRLG